MGIKILVMASGRGSNFEAIYEAVRSGKIPNSSVVGLVTNNPNAPVIHLAHSRNVAVDLLNDKAIPKDAYEARLLELLNQKVFDYIALAGYMKIISKQIIERFPNRILNVHPSLLPQFKGLRAQKQALDAGLPSTGCTVHFVTEQMDAGPILGQRKCPILPGDTEDSLSQRLLPIEHDLYVHVLAELAVRKIKT